MPDNEVNVSRRHLVVGGAMGAIAIAAPALAQTKAKAKPAVVGVNKESLDSLKALHDAYFNAFSKHDTAAVLALFAPNAVVIGTGPGEIWGGHDEIGQAHKNFFQGFDPGKHESESLFRDGNVVGDMAWALSMSKVKFTKGADVTEFGLNVSMVFEKTGGKWMIRAMHFSNLTAAQSAAKP